MSWSVASMAENFRKIEQVRSAGKAAYNGYQYQDKEAGATNYYRLKMVDLDGSVEYSRIIQLKTDCRLEDKLHFFPNPISKYSNLLTVKFYSEAGEALLSISDISGTKLRAIRFRAEDEWNSIRLNISDLAPGLYFISLDNEKGQRVSRKLTIQE